MLSVMLARQLRAGVGLAGQDVGFRRAEQHVVEGQAEGDVHGSVPIPERVGGGPCNREARVRIR